MEPNESIPTSKSATPESPTSEPNTVVQDTPAFTPDPEALIKALLFSTPEYLNIKMLKELMEDYDTNSIRKCIKNINKKMNANEEPFEIVEINGSFRFRTRSVYYPWLKKMFKETGARRLSQAALEILAIVAYKQPISKAEVEDIRGVNVDGTLRGLLEKKLIKIVGKSDRIGSAFTYGTTKEFLQYFNINKVPDDLPKLSEFENMIKNSSLIPQINQAGQMINIQNNEAEVLDDPIENTFSMPKNQEDDKDELPLNPESEPDPET